MNKVRQQDFIRRLWIKSIAKQLLISPWVRGIAGVVIEGVLKPF